MSILRPAASRLSGALGVTFVLGSVIAASSLEESRAMWTPDRTRTGAEEVADTLVHGLARDGLPSAAQSAAQACKQSLVAIALARRPVLQALALTNCVVGALLALTALSALKLRPRGRTWLVQTAGAAIGFAGVQITVGSRLAVEKMEVLTRFMIEAGLEGHEQWKGLRWLAVVPPLVVGLVKVGFLGWLIALLRNPTVRELYRTP